MSLEPSRVQSSDPIGDNGHSGALPSYCMPCSDEGAVSEAPTAPTVWGLAPLVGARL